MLYFLISFLLFFTSAQSNNTIDAYFSAFTGEFEKTPEAISVLAERISMGFSNDSSYYFKIPQNLKKLGFLPQDDSNFNELMFEVLRLASTCYYNPIKINSAHIYSEDEVASYRVELFEKLTKIYTDLKDYFVNNHAILGIETLPATPEEVQQLFMSFLIANDLNMLTPHQLGISNFYSPRFPLNTKYIQLLLNLKDQQKITVEILNNLNLFLLDSSITPDDIQSSFNDLERIFGLRNQLLAYPLNEFGDYLKLGIDDYFRHLSELLKKTDPMNDKIKSLIDNHKTHFPYFSE